MTEDLQCEVLTRQALEAQRLRDEGAAAMVKTIEEGIEKRLGELVYAGGFPVTISDVKDAVRSLACAACRGSGLIRQGCKCSQVVSQLLPPDRYHPSECETGGVKYCACRFGAEQYQRDLTRTDVITAPITREWHLFPKSQYGTPEFLQLCMDQAAEARKVGRLACANALDRYVERELLSAKPGESIASAAKRAELVPPKPPQMEVVKD